MEDAATLVRRGPRTEQAGAPLGWRATVQLLMVAGAGLVAWSAAIHLDLWHTGYRDIATTRRLLPALTGALFLAATIGGFVWSTEWGLFGFQDSFGANFATLALAVETAGTVVLAAAAVLRIASVRRSRPRSS
jgi:hypothetical protein